MKEIINKAGAPSVFGWVILFAMVMAVMVSGTARAGETGPSGEPDELTMIMEDDGAGPMRPLAKIGSAVIWDGPVEAEGANLYCAGIVARIILSNEESEYPETRFIDIGGEQTTLEAMVLSDVQVGLTLTPDGTYVVKWVLQGPVLILRGRITELDPEYRTLTVKGFDITVTENTRLKKYHLLYPNEPLRFSDLKIGMPVYVVAHEGEYTCLGLGVLAGIPPRRAVLEAGNP